jgi:uncharacterized membrane protein required for colicin V production
MMELSFFLRICIVFFGVMGYLRGFYREFVSLAGIVLGLFILVEFGWLVDFFLGYGNPTLRFLFNALILIILTFFAYQQAPTTFVPSRYRRGRSGTVKLPENEGWQTRSLGALIGGFNGYLVVGSLWYFMDQLQYPLYPLFMMPNLGTESAEFVANLPLVWLQQFNLLTIIVVVLLLVIFIAR